MSRGRKERTPAQLAVLAQAREKAKIVIAERAKLNAHAKTGAETEPLTEDVALAAEAVSGEVPPPPPPEHEPVSVSENEDEEPRAVVYITDTPSPTWMIINFRSIQRVMPRFGKTIG
jgi:hypothetical protein